jgi:uncharacterized protein YodC (DUF2158 family)
MTMSDNRNVGEPEPAAPFPVGTAVRLKSGGPNMTVTGCHRHEGAVSCAHFVGETPHFTVWLTDALTLAKPEPLL